MYSFCFLCEFKIIREKIIFPFTNKLPLSSRVSRLKGVNVLSNSWPKEFVVLGFVRPAVVYSLTNEDLREKPENDIWRYLRKAVLFVHARSRAGTRDASVGFARPWQSDAYVPYIFSFRPELNFFSAARHFRSSEINDLLVFNVRPPNPRRPSHHACPATGIST